MSHSALRTDGRRRFRRSRVAGLLGVLALSGGWANVALAHPVLTDSPANGQWYAPEGSDEIVFIGQAGEDATELAIRKSAFTTRPLELEVQADAEALVIRSGLDGEQRIRIEIEPDAPNRLTLDGDRLHPRLRWQGRELAPLRGQWVRLLLREDPHLLLELPGATYVNVRVRSNQTWTPGPLSLPESGAVTPAAEAAPSVEGSQGGLSVPPVAPKRTATPSDQGRVGYPTGVKDRQPTPVLVPPEPDRPEQETLLGDVFFDEGWRLSLEAGAETATEVIYRGLSQENQNAILQPYADFDVTLYRRDQATFLNQVDVVFGMRTSHYWGPSGGDRPTRNSKLVEANWYGGLSARMFERWTLSVYPRQRTQVTGKWPGMPNGDVHSVEVMLEFDDSTPAYDWSLQPYALSSLEYEGQSDAAGALQSGDLSIYLEVGVRPEFELFKIGERVPVTLAVPARVGLSIDDYYQDPLTGDDDVFGFFDVGLEVGLPLASIPAGDHAFVWRLTAGVHFVVLGENAADISHMFGTGDDEFRVVGMLGLSVTY